MFRSSGASISVHRRLAFGVVMLVALNTALALGLAFPMTAFAAKHNKLTVKPCAHPGHGCGTFSAVTQGQAFALLIQGYAKLPANDVLIFVGTAPCASTYGAEAERERAHEAVYVRRVAVGPRRFGYAVPISAAKSATLPLGNDYVCAYLKKLILKPLHVTKPTYAHASLKLTVTAS